jgi:hypothetical protein
MAGEPKNVPFPHVYGDNGDERICYPTIPIGPHELEGILNINDMIDFEATEGNVWTGIYPTVKWKS